MIDYAARAAQADTFPKLLRLNACEHGDEVALREKDFGLWRVVTWSDYQSRVRDFALGMLELGLEARRCRRPDRRQPARLARRRDRHPCDRRHELSASIATPCRRRSPICWATAGRSSYSRRTRSRSTSCSALGERVPGLRHIIYCDPRGMRKHDDPRLIEAGTLAALGRRRAAREPLLYDRLVDATRGEDVAILCTTSGTTAQPEACDAAGRPPAAPLRRLSRLSIPRGRTTSTSRCCRCPGSWSRSMPWAKACSAG